MKTIRISCKLPIEDYEKIERLVELGRYKRIGDFVRIAIRELLAEEILECDEKTLEKIKEVLGIDRKSIFEEHRKWY